MGYVSSFGPLGAFHEEQHMIAVSELFVLDEIFPRKVNHSYGSSKMSSLLCARRTPAIRAALFSPVAWWVHRPPGPGGCRIRHILQDVGLVRTSCWSPPLHPCVHPGLHIGQLWHLQEVFPYGKHGQ